MKTKELRDNQERTCATSHPWINFEADFSKSPYTLWLLLGEAHSKCQHIAGVPLPPETASELYKVYLSKGVHATTSIEGNTLSIEQVQQQVEGTLKLPASQRYLGMEVQNVIDVCNGITKDLLKDPTIQVTPERILHFNALVLKGLDEEEHVVPGDFRKVSVGVLGYRGAPWQDCQHLVERLCEWLNGSAFVPPDGKLKFAFTLFKAILAHLYIAWIHPFGNGNGRTARLIEFQILLQSGMVPLPACHLLSNHYNKTRTRYYAELDKANKPGVGVVPFIEYAIEGFVDGLREQLEYIRSLQWKVAWENYVHDRFRGQDTPTCTRQKHLVLDMPDEPTLRKDLPLVSPRVAMSYAGKGEKTLTRDLNALKGMNLIVRKGKGYVPHRNLILAFLPPRCETAPEKPEDMLF